MNDVFCFYGGSSGEIWTENEMPQNSREEHHNFCHTNLINFKAQKVYNF